ncbi:unnamed protein product [Bemisia tabaci]|uniref:Ubiquitin-like protease family profile domain-containing protein n=1 Tax=Bemisia tabaci TaxID=7038 RepID=A0A9P0F9C3_BEMTA|nr:unnamed protein product [Bemisia tabaci]
MDDLIELLEDMEHERYLKLEDRRLKGEPHKDFNKPDARHSRSMKIPHSAITTLSNNKWLVKSVKRKEVLYLVTKKIEQCNLDHCYDKCNNMSCFGLCVHLYDCNCPDKVGMCKHIHRIHSFSTRNEHRSVTIISNDNENAQISNESCEKDEEAMNPECNAVEISTIDVEEEVCLTQFCRSDDNDGTSANQNNSSNASNKDEAAQFDILVDELRRIMQNSDSELRSHILTSLRSEISFCKSQPEESEVQISFKPSLSTKKSSATVPPMPCSFAPNQKSPCQPRMYKTIKKRKISCKSYAKPNREELECLSQELLNYKHIECSNEKNGSAAREEENTIETLQLELSSHPDSVLPPQVSTAAESNITTETSQLELSSLPDPITFLRMIPEAVSLKTSPKSHFARRKKGQIFSSPLTDSKSAAKSYRFEDLHVSELELKSVDPNISNTEVAFLTKIAKDFVKGWLYDSVINIFLRIHSHQKSNIFILETAFTQAILDCNSSSEDVLLVLPSINYRALKYLIIPVNTNGHWILFVFNFFEKKILIFDPICEGISASHLQCLSRLNQVLSVILHENLSAWAKPESPKHHLQQDRVSCGVFISFYALKIIQNENPNMFFDVEIFRHYIYTSITAAVQPC